MDILVMNSQLCQRIFFDFVFQTRRERWQQGVLRRKLSNSISRIDQINNQCYNTFKWKRALCIRMYYMVDDCNNFVSIRNVSFSWEKERNNFRTTVLMIFVCVWKLLKNNLHIFVRLWLYCYYYYVFSLPHFPVLIFLPLRHEQDTTYCFRIDFLCSSVCKYSCFAK